MRVKAYVLNHPARVAVLLTVVVTVSVLLVSVGLFPRVEAGVQSLGTATVTVAGCQINVTLPVNNWGNSSNAYWADAVTHRYLTTGDWMLGVVRATPATDFTPSERWLGCGPGNTIPAGSPVGTVYGCATSGTDTTVTVSFTYAGSGGNVTIALSNEGFETVPWPNSNPGVDRVPMFHGGSGLVPDGVYPAPFAAAPHTTTVAMPDCSPAATGGGAAGPAAPPPPPPLDPPGSPPRVWGGYNENPTPLVVYNTSYGYQFYHASGQVIGLIDFNAVGIPGPLGLITSFSSGIWRVDVYYLYGDRVQANLYENGVLIEEAGFDVPGVGARAGEVAGQPVPPFGGGGGAGGVAVAAAPGGGQVQLVCRQNLRQNASTDTPILLVMDTGSALNVVGRSNDNTWLEVTTADGVRGWAFNGRCLNAPLQNIQQAPVEVVFGSQPTVNPSEALTQQQAPAGTANVAAPAATGGPVVGIICRQNLRTGPGTNFTVDRVLETGTSLNVVGRSNDGTWLQVTAGAVNGWTYFGTCVLPQSGDVTAAPVTVAFGG